MSKQKINFKIGFPAFIMITLLVALVLMSQRPGRPSKPRFSSDKYTTEIPAGSFYMGPSDEQVDLSMVNIVIIKKSTIYHTLIILNSF